MSLPSAAHQSCAVRSSDADTIAGDCDIRPFAPLPPLKRGRSRVIHEKLVAAIQAEEEKLIHHLRGIVHDLQRRIRVHKSKAQW
jgi:hypothetical protein